MKHFKRLLLLAAALAVGGGLGLLLLPVAKPGKMAAFLLACFLLGEVFYRIGRRLSQK